MRVEKDFKEFIALLNKFDIRYLIIGGFAYSFYVEPRYTKDIDILISQSEKNVDKILQVLQNFGFEDIDLTEKDFFEPEQVIQLGIAPVRIDILTSLKNMEFTKLWKNRVMGHYGDIKVNLIYKILKLQNCYFIV